MLEQSYVEGLKDLSRAFKKAEWALGGGVALILMGLQRTTNDIDCFVDKPRSSLLQLLQGRDRWTFTHNVRNDYVSFFFDNKVLFEFFPTNLDCFVLKQLQLPFDGRSFTVPLLPAVALFRGKLNAAACRTGKHYDKSDLIWLMRVAGREISAARSTLPPPDISGAVQNFSDLEAYFSQLRILVDGSVRGPDRSPIGQAQRQTRVGGIQAALGTSVVYSRTAGGSRAAGEGHPYASLFNQVQLMMASGTKTAAMDVGRLVPTETFLLALGSSYVLFDLSSCDLTTSSGRERREHLSQQHATRQPGHWKLAQEYQGWYTLRSHTLAAQTRVARGVAGPSRYARTHGESDEDSGGDSSEDSGEDE